MDVRDLQASLQALMDQQAAPQTPDPRLVGDEPVPHPFYEQHFEPVEQPTYPTYTFDDHLLEETESAGNIVASNSSNASYRAKRTGFQGLVASALIAVGGVFTSISLDTAIDWRLLGLSVGQAVLTAVITWLHNDNSAGNTSG